MSVAIIVILVELAWIGCWELIMLWSRRRSGGDAPAAPPAAVDTATDVYDIAYLSGGPRRVAQVALLRLYSGGHIEKSASGGRLRAAGNASPDPAHPEDPVAAAALAKVSSTSWPVLSLIRTVAAAPAVDDVRTRLTARGLFLSWLPSRILALAGPIGLLAIVVGSVPVVVAVGGPLPWLPVVVGLLALVAWGRWPGARPTIRGRILLNRRRRAGAGAGGGVGGVDDVALRGAAALGADDPRRTFFPALPPRRRRLAGPRHWDPDLGGSDFIDRWLLRDLRVLLRAEHSHDHYLIDGISAFWSDHHTDGGHHPGHGGHHSADWGGGGDHGGFGSGHHSGW